MSKCPTIIVVAAEVPLGDNTISCTEGLSELLSKLSHHSYPWVLSTTPSLVSDLRSLVRSESQLLCAMSHRLAQGSFGACIAEAVLARPQSEGWLVVPANMPDVELSTLQLLSEGLDLSSLVFPQYKGLRGYPVAFGPELYSELVALQVNERGTQRMLARYPGYSVEVDDPAVLRHAWGGSGSSKQPLPRFLDRLYSHQSQ